MESIYYDPNWTILQQEKEGGYAEKFRYYDKNCSIEYPFIMRKAGIIDGIQYYDILSPRGMGGPKCNNGGNVDLKKYKTNFSEYCKEKNIIAEYVRFDPWICNHKLFGGLYDDVEHHGNLFCNNLSKNFFKEEYDDNVKRNIKKNINNIEVQFDFEGEITNITKFLELYKYTENKYEVSDYYKLSEEYICSYFKKLKGKVAIAKAIYDGKIVSSSIILFGKDIVHYHFACNNPEYKKFNANTVLLYKTSIMAQTMGKSLFDLGGGLFKGNTAEYKSRFVRKDGIYPYYVGKRILNHSIYSLLVEKNGRNIDGFFPEYNHYPED